MVRPSRQRGWSIGQGEARTLVRGRTMTAAVVTAAHAGCECAIETATGAPVVAPRWDRCDRLDPRRAHAAKSDSTLGIQKSRSCAASPAARGRRGHVRARFDFPRRTAMIASCANHAASPPIGARSASFRAADPGSPGYDRVRARATPSRGRLDPRLDPARTHPNMPATGLCVPCSHERGGARSWRSMRLELWPRSTRTGTANLANLNNRRLFHRRTRRSTTS